MLNQKNKNDLQYRTRKFKRKKGIFDLYNLRLNIISGKRIRSNEHNKPLIKILSQVYNVNEKDIKKVEEVSKEDNLNTVLKVIIKKDRETYIKYCKAVTKEDMQAILYTKILKDYKDKDKLDKQNIKVQFLTTNNKSIYSYKDVYFQILDKIKENENDEKFKNEREDFIDDFIEENLKNKNTFIRLKENKDIFEYYKKILPELFFFALSGLNDYKLDNMIDGFFFHSNFIRLSRPVMPITCMISSDTWRRVSDTFIFL